jgi:hypothetical protein
MHRALRKASRFPDEHAQAAVVAAQVFTWIAFFLSTSRTWDALSVGAIIGSSLLLAAMAFVIGSRAVRQTTSLRQIAASALSLLSQLLVTASITYYSIGVPRNWNMRLSHVDAMLVSVGTLTTAGTADITPSSELARRLLLGQMVIDFLVVTIVIGIVLQRLANRPSPSEEDRS